MARRKGLVAGVRVVRWGEVGRRKERDGENERGKRGNQVQERRVLSFSIFKNIEKLNLLKEFLFLSSCKKSCIYLLRLQLDQFVLL